MTGFYLLWFFTFKNDTFYKINRIYLLSSTIISLILPFIEFSINTTIENTTFSYLLENVTITSNQITNSVSNFISTEKLIFIIYISGVIIFIIRFIIRLFSVIKLIFKHNSENISGNKIIKLNKEFSPFSFLNYVFISNNQDAVNKIEKIMKHEEIHVKQLHTIDNIFFELLTVILWFNPIIYFFHKALKETHEYLADEGVIEQGFDSAKYQLLLLEQSIGVQYGFATNFNKSLTLKRLAMMNRKSSKIAKLKLLLVLPLVSVMFLVFSCGKNDEFKKSLVTNESIPMPPPPPPPPVPGDTISEKVYDEVDVMPEFPGGMEALSAFIVKNIVYPEKAKKEGITANIYVQFVVSKTGKVENVVVVKTEDNKVVKTDYEIFSAEAIRVISLMPDWTPGLLNGEPVNVSFTIPIKFNLK
jgi:TonB family protein